MRRIISFIGAALLMCSCIYEDLSDCPNYIQGIGKPVDVEFRVSCSDSTETKSSISASETAVTNLNLLVYYDGKLEASSYIESPTSFSMSLVKGRTYNMYALANMGKVTAPSTEDQMLSYQYSISKITDIKQGFPMCWRIEDKTISGTSPSISIILERMVSRINFNIDSSELEDFTVTAVRLRQGALKMYPFFENGSGGSRASSPSDVGDGDWASSSDLTRLNAGGKATFYALENCQGVLLPGNKSAESKIPSEIPSSADLCTYLEMTASYSGEYEGVPVSSDNVVYRFYIGNDNCSDFNVIRNNDVDISLTVTRDRIFDESWRVSYGEDLPNIAYGLANSESSVSLNVGGSTTLSATYYRTVDGARDSETDVTSYAAWTSSNPSVATVSGGKITGVAAGTATITATYNGYKATTTVTVNNVMGYGLVMSKSTLSVQAESTATLAVYYVTYTNGVETSRTDVTSSATWKTSMSSIATVSGGTVTGVSAGQAVVTATYRSYSKSCTVTVTKKPVTYTYALQVKLADPTIYVGDATAATATYITYADGVQSSTKDVTSSATWSSGTTAIATVSGGTVTAIAAGTSEISASYNGYSAKTSVTVEDKITYDYQLTPTSTSLVNGRTTKFTVVKRTFTNGTQTNGQDVSSTFTWTSSNTSVATVGSNGVVTGVGKGTATITATYGSTTLTGTVTVTPAYTYELVLNRTSMSMAKGATGTIVATYKTYADGVLESSTNVTSAATWSSGNTSVATVSGGTVTGKGAGTTTITATYNGKSTTCSVTVVGSATLSLGWTSATMEKGAVRTNAAIYNPNNGTASTNVTSSAVWTTSNAGVATAGSGTITAQGKGTCTITVTYNGLSASCTVTVTDNDTPQPNAYVSNMSVQSVNIPGTSNYKLQLSIRFSDGTVIEDAPYTWSVTFAQNSAIATGTSGTGPLVYAGGGSTYTMAVAIQTQEYYYNSSGNRQQFSTGTSFSHNTSWKP